jgi:hypothetical protein
VPWFPLSDELYSDARFLSLSADALALWTRAASWSADRLADGLIPTATIALFPGATDVHAAELVEAGVWKRARGGWQFENYPESAKRGAVEARRSADKRRQQNKRRSEKQSSRRDTTRDEHVTPQKSHRESDAPYTSFVPTERAGKPQTSLFDSLAITAQDVTAAWIDATRENGVQPSKGQIGRLSAMAKQALEAGNDPELVLAAAESAGSSGHSNLDSSITWLASQRNGRHLRSVGTVTRDPETGARVEFG